MCKKRADCMSVLYRVQGFADVFIAFGIRNSGAFRVISTFLAAWNSRVKHKHSCRASEYREANNLPLKGK